jgi:hypothetical protein
MPLLRNGSLHSNKRPQKRLSVIDRPQIRELRESSAIAALRETGDCLEEVATPIKEMGCSLANAALLYVTPMLLIPAWMILEHRSPEFFGTFWAYLALVALFGFFIWHKFVRQNIATNAKQRYENREHLEDSVALRSELHRLWQDGGPPE